MADAKAVLEVKVAAPVDAVWEAFRDPAQIRRWHGWEYDGLDEEIRLIYEEETTASEADRTLQIGGHLFALGEAGRHTVVRVTRRPPAGAEDEWNRYRDEIEEGWRTFLQQLRFALTRRAGEERRTVYLSGRARSADPAPPATVLGLGDVAAVWVNRRYPPTTVAGEELAGKVWFRSPHQLGLTVDGWGPGLLVLTGSPSALPAHSAASATLTTYGLSDEALEALRQRWSSLWETHYRSAEAGQ